MAAYDRSRLRTVHLVPLTAYDAAGRLALDVQARHIARMYAARRSGLKKEMFGYVRGGYSRILGHFAGALIESGCELRTGTKVEEIEPSADGPRVVVEQQQVFHGGSLRLRSVR